MSNLHEWFNRHAGRPLDLAAFRDLQTTLGTYTPPLPAEAPGAGKSEAWAQSMVRMEASQKGIKLFRNNVGALKDERGRLVRYGLGNDSPQMNDVIKSGDLIGIRPLLIQPCHVGHTVGQFVSREIKEPGWQFTGQGREAAQLAWANLINSCGGDAGFATGPGTL
jgi:hypothetical protein